MAVATDFDIDSLGDGQQSPKDDPTRSSGDLYKRKDVVNDFLAFLSRERVRYCVLGDIPEDFPQEVLSDVDIAFDIDSEKSIREIIQRYCQENPRAKLVSVIRHEHSAFFFVLAFIDETGGYSFLQIDACIDYYRDGRLLIESKDLILNRSKVFGSNGLEFFVPAPAAEFKYYLIKKIEKKNLNESAGKHLSACWQKDMKGCMSILDEYFKEEDSVFISHAAEIGNWDSIAERISKIRKGFHKTTKPTISDRATEFFRLSKRVIKPSGFWIAIFGPDGIGKSTLIDSLTESFAPAFWGVSYKHFRPRLDTNIHGDSTVVTDPHAKEARSAISSSGKMVYYFFDYWIGYLTNIRLLLAKSHFVIFDRYADDIKVDKIRYRYSGPAWLVNWMCKLIPRPDILVVLDAPASLIQSRKSEVTEEETERQMGEYRKIASSYSNAILVDASGSPDEVFIAVQAILVEKMAQRYLKA